MTYPITKKSWGMEIEIINNEFYCYKVLVCVHHRWSSKGKYHYHKIKDETFFIVKGKLEVDIYNQLIHKTISHILLPQEIIRIKPNVRHRFRSIGNSCTFYEISTHHSDNDSIRI